MNNGESVGIGRSDYKGVGGRITAQRQDDLLTIFVGVLAALSVNRTEAAALIPVLESFIASAPTEEDA